MARVLGAAYVRAGRLEDAERAALEGVACAERDGSPEAAAELRRALELLRDRRVLVDAGGR